MSYHAFGSDTPSAVRRQDKCPGCGQPGQGVGEAVVIMWTPGGGGAIESINAWLYRCSDCGVKFAVAEKPY